ncbi:hypothetical protein QQS21_005663 [Conoideocrella luteorostrata]|uniref:FAD dependent oxidoreductase domain-containing protein n=1 Tax=Conoideocrella luteorostrata TaxID=1105319 RepID=A0AAJ0CRZ8_9HYPO|nr:hypothetical protein QQS21_005663 [Conoideocrella luteorostrata]
MSCDQTIIIIGAGVVGLSTAIKLQEKLRDGDQPQPQILMIAREWPAAIPGAPLQHSVDYVSMWAGAHVRPIPATTPQLQQEADWLRQTVTEFSRILNEESSTCGISPTIGVEYLEAPDPSYLQQDTPTFLKDTGLEGYKRLKTSELPSGVSLGFEYQTFCIHPPVYCEALLRKFVLHGGKTLKMDLKSDLEPFDLVNHVAFVINASGSGINDSKCFPIRGQSVVTDLVYCHKTITRQNKDGTLNFLIPRFFDGGTVIGGTKEKGDWRSQPCAATREKMIKDGLDLKNSCYVDSESETTAEVRVIADMVGRATTRDGGMRIEIEDKTATQHTEGGAKRMVIHAYGAGGRGYEISWGVANDVVKLATSLLAKAT